MSSVSLRDDGAPAKRSPARGNAILTVIVISYALFWLWLAIEPYDRLDWVLDNIPVFCFVGLVYKNRHRIGVCNTAYLLTGAFLALHTYGAHFTYGSTPLPSGLNSLLGAGRNNFDRLMHLSFGLLMAYPIWQWLVSRRGVRPTLAYALATLVIIVGEAVHGIVVLGMAQCALRPPAGMDSTVGGPGTFVPNLMLALGGTLVSLAITALAQRRQGTKADM